MIPSRWSTSSFRSIGVLTVTIVLVVGCGGNATRESSTTASDSVAASAPATISGTAGHLHVDDGGEGGLPVVFVHSFAGSGEHWSNQLDHLRPARRAVALDLRGHGRSDAPGSNHYSVDSLAGDIAAVVDGLGLQRFVLVGHSMGGVAAAAYAGAHPDRVAGLVLVGSPGKSAPEMGRQVMGAMEKDYEKVSEAYWNKLLESGKPEVQQKIRGQMGSVAKEPSLAIMRSIFAYDPLPALVAYPGSVLIVDTPHGESPTSLHRQVPKAPRKLMTGTSHWPQMDDPTEFNAILDEFLATLPATS